MTNKNVVPVVKEKMGKRYLQAATVATAFALPVLARAEEVAPFMTKEELKAIVDGLGMPLLIGAAVASMLGIGILIWGGKRLVGFFSR
ncbi:hypothetical protein [Acinetobacter baumannii]|uniref:hypothetical protein n=1 Tax=Acinetobacter baumannii TaxID=470 RepID=UPI00389158C5